MEQSQEWGVRIPALPRCGVPESLSPCHPGAMGPFQPQQSSAVHSSGSGRDRAGALVLLSHSYFSARPSVRCPLIGLDHLPGFALGGR